MARLLEVPANAGRYTAGFRASAVCRSPGSAGVARRRSRRLDGDLDLRGPSPPPRRGRLPAPGALARRGASDGNGAALSRILQHPTDLFPKRPVDRTLPAGMAVPADARNRSRSTVADPFDAANSLHRDRRSARCPVGGALDRDCGRGDGRGLPSGLASLRFTDASHRIGDAAAPRNPALPAPRATNIEEPLDRRRPGIRSGLRYAASDRGRGRAPPGYLSSWEDKSRRTTSRGVRCSRYFRHTRRRPDPDRQQSPDWFTLDVPLRAGPGIDVLDASLPVRPADRRYPAGGDGTAGSRMGLAIDRARSDAGDSLCLRCRVDALGSIEFGRPPAGGDRRRRHAGPSRHPGDRSPRLRAPVLFRSLCDRVALDGPGCGRAE